MVGKCGWKREEGDGGGDWGETYWHVLVTLPIAGDNIVAFTLEAFS